MINCFVTGAAGFIGSHLCQRLIKEGTQVTGVDSFTDFYPRWIKEKNLLPLLQNKGFQFREADINDMELESVLKSMDYIFHLAAQAGVRASWGSSFLVYTRNNIEATQKLLETARNLNIKKFIFASSSSVYGTCPDLPMKESSPLLPYSPYGVTKLAGENLCYLYHKNYGLPLVSLRFFTVYGPRQRPDMAFHKFMKAISENRKIEIYGDGSQTRDFTHVSDVIEACFSAIERGNAGETYNIGGGKQKPLKDLFPILEEVCGKRINICFSKKQRGDVPHTFADIEKAQKDLDYAPSTRLEDGLHEEWTWIQELYSSQ